MGVDGSFESLPYAEACRRVDFDFVEVREATRFGGGRLLLVSGVRSWADLRVTLEPLPHCDARDFWGIEVVGRLTASGLPALIDFCVVLPLQSIPGCKGIEIIGATRSERRVLDPCKDADTKARG